MNPEPPAADADLHLAVAADHADLLLRQSSAVLTADAPCEPANAVRWGRAVLAELPGARIATAPAIDGTVTAVTRDGIYALQAQKPLAPALAGSALYAAITGPWTEPPDRLDVDLGARRVEVMIRPLRGPDAHG